MCNGLTFFFREGAGSVSPSRCSSTYRTFITPCREDGAGGVALTASFCVVVPLLWLSDESELWGGQREGRLDWMYCWGLGYFNGWRAECVAAGHNPRIRSSVTSPEPVCLTKWTAPNWTQNLAALTSFLTCLSFNSMMVLFDLSGVAQMILWAVSSKRLWKIPPGLCQTGVSRNSARSSHDSSRWTALARAKI